MTMTQRRLFHFQPDVCFLAICFGWNFLFSALNYRVGFRLHTHDCCCVVALTNICWIYSAALAFDHSVVKLYVTSQRWTGETFSAENKLNVAHAEWQREAHAKQQMKLFRTSN